MGNRGSFPITIEPGNDGANRAGGSATTNNDANNNLRLKIGSNGSGYQSSSSNNNNNSSSRPPISPPILEIGDAIIKLIRGNTKHIDPFLRDIKLKVGKVISEDVVTKVEDRVLREMQDQPRYKLITRPAWRESVQSLKPLDVIFKLGEANSGLKANHSGALQDFKEIKEQCLAEGKLFEDPTFLASDKSFYLHGSGARKFRWIRPHQIVDDPLFFSEGAQRFDVCQGEIGNCWFLAAVANLTLSEKYFNRVVPDDQSFNKSEYAGIFHFRFWQYGKWIDVVIDDRLPTYNGKLMMMHSKDRNEFWSALLEKAYAKLHGSYESLKGGTTSEAMEDFTGGLSEHYEIQSEECPEDLFKVMKKAHQRGSFMGCSITAVDPSQMEAVLPNGLIKGHAYSITSIKYVQVDHFKVQGKIPLVRVRNPWGNEAEWTGPWSDKSREWTIVSDAEKRMLGLTFDSDGEFWMSFVDFKKNFTNIEITNLTPDSLDEDLKRRWEVNYFEGQWVPGVSAGGCRNQLETFHLNPQYMVTLVDHDEDDDDDMCTFVVALMQKNHRIKRKMGLDNLTIGFAIYEVKDNALGLARQTPTSHHLLTTNFFRYNASAARSATFINLREISGRFRLKPGRYCIIPSTFEPNQKGEFLIRFFTEKPVKNVAENDEEVGPVEIEDNGKQQEDDKNKGIYPSVPIIEEPIINNWREDPDPDPVSGLMNGLCPSGSNMNYMSLISTCISLVSLASQCYAMMNKQSEQQLTAGSASRTESGGRDTTDPEKSAYSFFKKIAGPDLEVGYIELQQVLDHVFKKEIKFDGFSIESCRSMIAMMDSDGSGKLGFNEFILLWRSLRNWCEIFKKHDIDNSNSISAGELKEAFREVGINLNRQILLLLVNRYGRPSKVANKVEDELLFDDFICCAIKLKRCVEAFNSRKAKSASGAFSIFSRNNFGGIGDRFGLGGGGLGSNDQSSSFTLDEFIRHVLYS